MSTEPTISPEPTRTPAKKKSAKRVITRSHAFWYHFCQFTLYVGMKLYFRIKYIHSENVPKKGPTLLVSNHQSFLDPPAIGCGYYRMTNFLARKTLFKFKPFGKLIDSVDAIPLDKQGMGFQGVRETLRRLKNNEAVLIFPEGSRSFDGELAPFTSGYAAMAIKSNACVVPVAISGAFEAYPRTKAIPSPFGARVKVEYGEPLSPEFLKTISEEEVNDLVVSKIREMYERNRPRPRKHSVPAQTKENP